MSVPVATKESVVVPQPQTVYSGPQQGAPVADAQPEGIVRKDVSIAKEIAPKTSSAMAGIVRAPFLFLIRAYQKTLSLDHGPMKIFVKYGFCRFYPSCSQYAYDAIKKRGILVGIFLGSWRILRCNPLSHGGTDHVPDKGVRKIKKEA